MTETSMNQWLQCTRFSAWYQCGSPIGIVFTDRVYETAWQAPRAGAKPESYFCSGTSPVTGFSFRCSAAFASIWALTGVLMNRNSVISSSCRLISPS
jgi:hypothetical protein